MFTPRTLIYFKNYFLDFYNEQLENVQRKIDRTVDAVCTLRIIPESIFKRIEGTDDLYEVRVEVSRQIFRVFCCFDKGNLIILFNGFEKKSQKTPRREIQRAVRIQKEYYREKATH